MIQLRDPPTFIFSEVDAPFVEWRVPAVRSAEDGRIEVYTIPRIFVYERTTTEAVLGMHEYEFLGEQA